MGEPQADSYTISDIRLVSELTCQRNFVIASSVFNLASREHQTMHIERTSTNRPDSLSLEGTEEIRL